MKDPNIRIFKLIYLHLNGDIITKEYHKGLVPRHAASSAFTKISKTLENKSEIKFGLQEITPNQPKNIYWYLGKKTRLQKPIELYQIIDNNNKKKYYTSEQIKQMGGFETVLNKKKKDCEVAITCKFMNTINEITKDECKELNDIIQSCNSNEEYENGEFVDSMA
jgi:hypothetical protein